MALREGLQNAWRLVSRRHITVAINPNGSSMGVVKRSMVAMKEYEVLAEAPAVCGRGDRKTKKGKRFRGTFGKYRPDRKHWIKRFKAKLEIPQSTPWPLQGIKII